LIVDITTPVIRIHSTGYRYQNIVSAGGIGIRRGGGGAPVAMAMQMAPTVRRTSSVAMRKKTTAIAADTVDSGALLEGTGRFCRGGAFLIFNNANATKIVQKSMAATQIRSSLLVSFTHSFGVTIKHGQNFCFVIP
jgi:hypothetical protein